MRTTLAVFKRELKSYFSSPMGYIYLIVFLVLTNWLFLRGFFITAQANFRGLFGVFPWIFLLFIPAVTMRLWAEERKLRTLEVLFTLPVRDHEVLLGKYLAALAFVVISLVLTLLLPITGSTLGTPDWGQIAGGYIGAFLLGATYLAIGLFASSITENQIVAFIVGAVLCFVFFIIGEDIVTFSMPGAIASVFQQLGLAYHFRSIVRGVIDSRDIIYYLSMIFFFLFLNLRTLELKR
jgi:ABC-2 type transport system permease protein